MAHKPMPPRRGLPDDAASDASDTIGARAPFGEPAGRFFSGDSAAPPRRGRRMLPDDDDQPTATQYAVRPDSIPVPPPPTPVPPFREGRAGASASATVIAADTATTTFTSPSETSATLAKAARESKTVWSPGPVSGDSDDIDGNRHGDDVIHHAPRRPGRRTRIVGLVVGGLVMALVAFFGIQALTREPGQGPTSSSEAAAPTPTTPPPFTTDDLPTVAEAGKAAPGTWSIIETVEKVTGASPQIACVGTGAAGGAEPTLSRIRAFKTTEGGPVLVVRLDAYPSSEAAHQVFQTRAAMVNACEGVPAYLSGASTVSGFADEVTQVTVIYQDAKTLFHTLLVARVGNSIVMTDALNYDQPIGAQQAVDATQPTLSRFCKAAQGTCPASPKAAAAPLPPTMPLGWLAPNDIPRVTPGAGQWSANEPFTPTTKGAFCEDLLLTRTDAKKASQRTYLLAQDSAMPQYFGLDEVSLTFADSAAAKAFGDKLANNVAQCPKRNPGIAKILESSEGTAQGAGGAAITARTWKFSLSIDQVKYWQVAVVTTGTTTIYLMTNTDATYGFSKDQYLQVALRSGLRATQQK